MFIIRSIEIANTGGNKKPKLDTHKKKSFIKLDTKTTTKKKWFTLIAIANATFY